jgi:hypothetical protein
MGLLSGMKRMMGTENSHKQEANDELSNKVEEGGNDMESDITTVAWSLAIDGMKQWRADVGIVEWKIMRKLSPWRLENTFNRKFEELNKEFLGTMTKSGNVTSLRPKMVTVCNVKFLHDVGNEVVSEYRRKERMSIEQFDSMISQGSLKAAGENNGRIYGYVDTVDLTLDDFVDTVVYAGKDEDGNVQTTTTKAKEFDCGNGIIEVITMDNYLRDRSGGMGNSEITRVVADNEIPYGTFQDIESGHEGDADAHTTELNKEKADVGFYDHRGNYVNSYNSRDKTEKDYYFNKVRSLLEKDFKNHKEAYDAVAGTIFPTRTRVFSKSKGNWSRPVKDAFTLPINCISKEQRKQLRAMYKDKIHPFVEAKEEARMLIASLKDAKDMDEVLTDVDTSMARTMLGLAAKIKRETGESPLSKKAWIAVHKIANPVVVTPEAQKRLGEITSLKTFDTTLRVTEITKIVGDHARDVLNAARNAKKHPLEYRDLNKVGAHGRAPLYSTPPNIEKE